MTMHCNKETLPRLNWRLAAFAVATFSCLALQAPAKAESKTFYVSRASYCATPDGRSWQTAWNNVDRIDWSKVAAGDTIKIDGGQYEMRYDRVLTVGADGTQSQPIKIVSADEPGRNGRVVIDGLYQNRDGINVGNHHDITIQGRTWRSILVTRCRNAVVTGPDSDHIRMKNLEVYYNGFTGSTTTAGIQLKGGENFLEQVIVRDNANCNVDIYCTKGYSGPQIKRCWIAQDTIGSYTADGIRFNDARIWGQQHQYINNSVLGPGLKTAIRWSQRNSSLHVSNNLFINPSVSCISKTGGTDTFYYSIINPSRNTLFLTPLNHQGMAHSNLQMLQGQDIVSGNVVYGGTVDVTIPPNGLSGRSTGNVQFKTAGNTTFLSSTQTDPQFASPAVYQVNSGAVPSRLRSLDFSFKPGSPATGKGSTITSVANLLSTNQ